MILSLAPDAQRLLAAPEHEPVLALLRQLVEASYEDTLAQLLFPAQPLDAGTKAVLEAEARVLMGLRKDLADASRAAPPKATGGGGANGNSPGGFV